MLRRPVDSSRIRSIGYANNVMEIEFKDGAVYQYLNVSIAEYQHFMSQPSLGSYLSIFDKRHRYVRVG